MSKSAEKASSAGQGEPQNDSVYDFLFHDARRIGSFLAQFDDSGHLTQVTQSESASKGAKRGYRINIGGGASVLGTGGQGSVGLERTPEEGGSESSLRVYDPLWTNALTFLDYLELHGLLERDLTRARLGQMVLATGSLTISDLAMMQSAWKLPTVQKLMKTGADASPPNRQQRRAAERSVQSTEPNHVELVIDLLSILPHAVQARLRDSRGEVWCSLSQASMVSLPSDLLLKHGTDIPGEWSMLGILDAHPDPLSDPDRPAQVTDGVPTNLIATLITSLVPVVRGMLGRPTNAFGVTPLLIFRKVSG